MVKNKPFFRALFTADLHMSNNLPYSKHVSEGVSDRLIDQGNLINRILNDATNYNCDAIFILGDVFDQSRVDAITLTETIRWLSNTPVDMYILPGNHDGINTRGERFIVEAFDVIPRIHYIGLDSMVGLDPLELADGLMFFPIPFMPIDKTIDVLKNILDKRNKCKSNVLLMHNSVVGCKYGNWKCEDGFGIKKNILSQFDYVLSGHFHTSQKIGKNGMYLGSPLHFRYDDCGRKSGYWIIEWDRNGKIKKKFIDGRCPKFHLIELDEWVDDLDINKNDYVKIDITCTSSELPSKKNIAQDIVNKLLENGVNAKWSHTPVYHHNKRITTDFENNVDSMNEIINKYLDSVDVNISGLNVQDLKNVGIDILESAKSNV